MAALETIALKIMYFLFQGIQSIDRMEDYLNQTITNPVVAVTIMTSLLAVIWIVIMFITRKTRKRHPNVNRILYLVIIFQAIAAVIVLVVCIMKW